MLVIEDEPLIALDGLEVEIRRRIDEVAVDAPVDLLASALVHGARRRTSGKGLSTREEQVLRLAAKGLAAKQIARALGISPKTVEQHKTRAFRRLGVPNQAAAVALVASGGAGR